MPSPELLEAFFSGVTLAPDAAVLDVGCQSAAALKWIREKYSLTGKLIGIDKRSKNFEDAETLRALGISLLEMNASEPLNFPGETFDLIFHCNTLECITDIAAHVRELHRVLKKGGTIVCVHRDWESIVFNGTNKALINKAVYGYANFLQAGWMDACDGWIGRRLWGHFNKTGLFSGAVSVHNSIETDFAEQTDGWRYIHDMNYFVCDSSSVSQPQAALEQKGFLTQAEYEELLADMKDTCDRGEYIYVSPYYVYTGEKL